MSVGRLFWITVSLLLANTAQAQDSRGIPDDEARYNVVLQEAQDDTALTFSALPAIEDKRTRNMVLRYSMAARGWWVGMRCKFGVPEDKSKFEANLSLFTNGMDMFLAGDFHKTLREGNAYSQTIQRYALNAMSAKKFYDCSDKAEDIWLVGQDEAERAGNILQKMLDDLNKSKTQKNK
jgi:hypothetical protein